MAAAHDHSRAVRFVEHSAGVQVAAAAQKRTALYPQRAADILHGILGKGALPRVFQRKGVAAAGIVVNDKRFIDCGTALRRHLSLSVGHAKAIQHAAGGHRDRSAVDHPAKSAGGVSLIELPGIADHAAQPQSPIYGKRHAAFHREGAERLVGCRQLRAVGDRTVPRTRGAHRLVIGHIERDTGGDDRVFRQRSIPQQQHRVAAPGIAQGARRIVIHKTSCHVPHSCHTVPAENGHRSHITHNGKGVLQVGGYQYAVHDPSVETAAVGRHSGEGQFISSLSRPRSRRHTAPFGIAGHRLDPGAPVRENDILQPDAILFAVD